MSTLKVGGIRGVSASSDAITVANDGTATGNLTNRQGKNLVINGEMQLHNKQLHLLPLVKRLLIDSDYQLLVSTRR